MQLLPTIHSPFLTNPESGAYRLGLGEYVWGESSAGKMRESMHTGKNTRNLWGCIFGHKRLSSLDGDSIHV